MSTMNNDGPQPPRQERRRSTVQEVLSKRRDEQYAHVEGPLHSGRLSMCTYLSYAAPSLSTTPCSVLISVYLVPFYETVGARLAYIAFFIALARSFDVLTDPLMSYFTDAFRSKFGRRRPFMLTGAIPYGLLFMFLCMAPAGWDPISTSIYFGILYVLFFLLGTYTNIPYDAVAPELTDNYEDRTNVFFFCTMFDGLGGLVAVGGPVGLTTMLSQESGCDYSSCYRTTNFAGNGAPGADGYKLNNIGSYGTVETCVRVMPDNVGQYMYTNETLFALQNNSISILNGKEACKAAFDGESISGPLAPYCTCRTACKSLCNLDDKRDAYQIIGIIFAVWYIVTMINATFQIKERSQLMMEKGLKLMRNPPLVPSLLNTFQNLPFKTLIYPWICDQLVASIITTLMVYYVRYIIAPEYQPQCLGGLSNSWMCDSHKVMGLSVIVILMCAILGAPVFMYIAKKFGKRNAWLIWSATLAFTNVLMLIPQEGDIIQCIIFAGINGLPIGAKFLSDSILADIIDYDEFITGTRSEATYTMFKSFLPKICAIPASAIPIALLNVFGHIPVSKEGKIQRQPQSVKNYIIVVIVIIPTLASILSFFLKIKFQLKTKEQVDKISIGVGKHLLGEDAEDPISGSMMPPPIKFDDTNGEQEEVWLFQHFTGLRLVRGFLEHGDLALQENKKRSWNHLMITSAFLLLTLSLSIYFFAWMGDEKLSFIPVLSIIFFGISMSSFVFFYLRYDAAKRLSHTKPSVDTVKKLLQNKLAVLPARKTHKSYIAKLIEHKRRSSEVIFEMTTPASISDDVKSLEDKINHEGIETINPMNEDEIANKMEKHSN